MLTELWNYAMSDDASATVLLESLNVIAEPRLNIIIHLTAGCMELLPRETQPSVVNNHRVSYAVDSDISVSTKIIDSSLHVIANVLQKKGTDVGSPRQFNNHGPTPECDRGAFRTRMNCLSRPNAEHRTNNIQTTNDEVLQDATTILQYLTDSHGPPTSVFESSRSMQSKVDMKTLITV
jgi:hypothetical protein